MIQPRSLTDVSFRVHHLPPACTRHCREKGLRCVVACLLCKRQRRSCSYRLLPAGGGIARYGFVFLSAWDRGSARCGFCSFSPWESRGEGIRPQKTYRFSHPISTSTNPSACINAAIVLRSSTPTSAIHPGRHVWMMANHFFDQILPHATTSCDIPHAQKIQRASRTAQRDAHCAQQAFVKTGGVDTMMFINSERRGNIPARFCPGR